MLKVGLTGGLASGKSFVAAELEALGAHVLHADRLGHEILLRGGEAFDAVLAEFGAGILDAAGEIDRRALGSIVFQQPERLAALNAIVHPHVWERTSRAFDEIAAADAQAVAIVEAAIMIETGSYRRFDRIVLVYCDEESQIRRAMKRDGLSEEAVRARLHNQMPLQEKRRFADYLIDTSGEKQQTLAQTRTLWEELRRIAI